jgi:hypothetical protein
MATHSRTPIDEVGTENSTGAARVETPAGPETLLADAEVTAAVRCLLPQVDPEDPQHRTYAERVAASLVRKAISGDVGALLQVLNRTEPTLNERWLAALKSLGS